MRKHLKSRRKPGFTLLELLMVIAIFVILAVSIFSSSVNANRQFSFQMNYNVILQTLREARNLAASNRTVSDSSIDYDQDGELDDQILPLGYGVVLTKGNPPATPAKLQLFRDMPQGETARELDLKDEIIRTIEIDKRFTLEAKSGGITYDLMTLYYEPPYGFANFPADIILANISLKDPDLGSEKEIVVHRISGVPEPAQ